MHVINTIIQFHNPPSQTDSKDTHTQNFCSKTTQGYNQIQLQNPEHSQNQPSYQWNPNQMTIAAPWFKMIKLKHSIVQKCNEVLILSCNDNLPEAK